MPRVDQQQCEAVLQQIPDGFPVHPGRLEHDVCDPVLGQPVGQRQQLIGVGAERADLAVRWSTRLRQQHTRHHSSLVHIQPAAARMNYVHPQSSFSLEIGRGEWGAHL